MDKKREASKHFLGWLFSLVSTDVGIYILTMIIIINGHSLHISGGNAVCY